MSRVGKNPITIPDKVKIEDKEGTIFVEGSKGKLDTSLPERVKIVIEKDKVLVSVPSNNKEDRALHGLARALIQNMVKGVTDGFERNLEISGVGYRAQVQGEKVNLSLGFSHPIELEIPKGITVKSVKGTQVSIQGADKAAVGQFAAVIRSYYPPEPYKGKGVKYSEERVRRKAGKSVAKA